MKTLNALLGLAVVVAAATVSANGGDYSTEKVWQEMVGKDGSIHMPKADFRRDWAVLGTWALTGDDGKVTGQHVVYSQRSTIDAFRTTGEFPDGAVLIKELLLAQSATLTTGEAAWATEISGWFVMIKDRKNRFPKNQLWGKGWGWAYFDAGDKTTSPTKSFRAECMGCHVPAKKEDWIYSYAYPVLAKK